jgi:hypothetical protein
LDAEVSEELRFHLARQTEANISAGMSAEEATRLAHLTVGNIEALRDESRAGRPGSVMHQAARDLALGMRLLRRAPGFAATAALIVALGIGTTTAIFSVVYGVLLRALPYPQPEQLVALWTRFESGSVRPRVNAADVRDLRDGNSVFEDMALANGPQNFNLVGADDPERVVAARLSSNVFSVLRVSPAIGRAFTEAMAFIRSDARGTLAILKKTFANFDDAVLVDAIDVVRKSTPASPAVTAEALANAENFNVEARLMKADVKLKSYDGLFTDAYVK